MSHQQQLGPRALFRKQEGQRIMLASSLSESYPKLKSLKVDLSFHTPDGDACSSEVKYKVNLEHTKSVFRFDCLNQECVRGDFDLSEVLATAVAVRKTSMIGELRCHGWRSKNTIQEIQCRRVLRYKISLGF